MREKREIGKQIKNKRGLLPAAAACRFSVNNYIRYIAGKKLNKR